MFTSAPLEIKCAITSSFSARDSRAKSRGVLYLLSCWFTEASLSISRPMVSMKPFSQTIISGVFPS
jgi:hypothetical protein